VHSTSGGRHAVEGNELVSIKFIEASGAEHEVSAQPGQTVMESAIWNNVPGVDAECGGSMACSTCLVHVNDEWNAKFPPATATEIELVSCHPFTRPGSRLSCQLRVVESMDGLILQLPPAQK
jgi:2Fe-2S ferredoxin